MRIYLKLTPNTEICPFDYQAHLVYRFHDWIGKQNDIHNKISLYSLSWLSKGRRKGKGLTFKNGANWFISAYNPDIIKKVIKGVRKKPIVAFGMQVQEVVLQEAPPFGNKTYFTVASPVFIKRYIDKEQQFYFYSHENANNYITETMQNKLQKAGLSPDIRLEFDNNYGKAKIVKSTYKGTSIKGSICPVIAKGTPEALAFAWNVGIGNGTGIGFGALN